jgi:inorganic triphosphatase YgiF
MATKTEIRLLLDANAMERVGRLPEVRAVRRGRANKRRLRAVYFDTPAADLRHAGATLWTRKEGGRWIQALRLDGHAAGGMDLQEWPVAGRTLDLKVLRETGAPRVFRDARFRKALDAAFETDFIRTSIALVLADGTCGELRLDSGEVIAGKRRAPISEIEIELIEGDRARLFDFAIGLVEALPVRVADAGKAARGYALMPGLSAVPVKAQIPALSKGMHVEDAFAEIGRSCLAQMQANETGVSAARDLEFLHQYRVGLRRLRSAFGLFKPVLAQESTAAMVIEMRWLSAYLGPARDWDVFCEQTLKSMWQGAGRDPAMAALQRRCARERASCAALVRETIASPRYAKFVLKLARLFATPEQAPGAPPLKAFAAARLQKRDRSLRKIARNLEVSDPAQVHGMRIAAKKLRYTSEFVQSLFPQKAAKDHARSLARLQDVLGDVNDSTTGLRLLDSLPPDRSEAGAYARGRVRESLAARKELVLGALSGHWDDLHYQKRYWKAALPPLHAAADEVEQTERETG